MTLSSWDLFVLRHKKPANLWVHFLSFLCFYGGPILALVTRSPYYLGLFLISGAIGAAGHHFTRDGGVDLREATSSPLVVFYVTVMFYKIVRGSYRHDISAALAKAQELGVRPDEAR